MKRIITVIFAALLLLSALTACGEAKDGENEKESSDTDTAVQETESAEETTAPEDETEPDPEPDDSGDAASDTFSVEKLGEIDISAFADVQFEEGGIIYKDTNGKYGVMSFDGKADTGAVYGSAVAVGKYFAVAAAKTGESVAPEDMNVSSLIDAEGRELIPGEYFMMEYLSERFVKAYRATQRTENEDEAMLYVSSGMLAASPGEDNPMYKGEWFIYDVLEGCTVEGAYGNTKEYAGRSAVALGNYIRYFDADGKMITLDAEGNALSDDTTLLSDGSSVKDGVVYGPDGEKLFTVDADGYIPYGVFGEYFAARRTDSTTYGSTYVILDRSGEIVVDESSDYLAIGESFGNILVADKTVYGPDGEIIAEGCNDTEYEACLRGYLLLETDSELLLLDKDGEIVTRVENTEELYRDGFVIKSSGEETCYYSYKDEDFTVKAASCGSVEPWFVYLPGEDNDYSLVDTYTGETVLSGYGSFKCVTDDTLGCIVYAYTDGVYEIFKISIN